MTTKLPELYLVYRKFFTEREQIDLHDEMAWVRFRKCPKWLGNFYFSRYGNGYDKGNKRIPTKIASICDRMAELVPGQKFSTIFVQRYSNGQKVLPHLDPKNNLGYTAIGVFGKFEGGMSVINNQRLRLETGDVLIMRCNIAGKLRPLHRLSSITSGTRYTVILNTIRD